VNRSVYTLHIAAAAAAATALIGFVTLSGIDFIFQFQGQPFDLRQRAGPIALSCDGLDRRLKSVAQSSRWIPKLADRRKTFDVVDALVDGLQAGVNLLAADFIDCRPRTDQTEIKLRHRIVWIHNQRAIKRLARQWIFLGIVMRPGDVSPGALLERRAVIIGIECRRLFEMFQRLRWIAGK